MLESEPTFVVGTLVEMELELVLILTVGVEMAEEFVLLLLTVGIEIV